MLRSLSADPYVLVAFHDISVEGERVRHRPPSPNLLAFVYAELFAVDGLAPTRDGPGRPKAHTDIVLCTNTLKVYSVDLADEISYWLLTALSDL